jgi:hypothetical protein
MEELAVELWPAGAKLLPFGRTVAGVIGTGAVVDSLVAQVALLLLSLVARIVGALALVDVGLHAVVRERALAAHASSCWIGLV